MGGGVCAGETWCHQPELPLIILLKEGSDNAKDWAAYALGVFAFCFKRSEQIFKADIIQPMISLLKNGSDRLKEQATYALGNLSFHSKQRCAEIVSAGAVLPLVALLKKGSELSTERAAFASSSDRWSDLIFSAGAVSPLVAILKVGSAATKGLAVKLI